MDFINMLLSNLPTTITEKLSPIINLLKENNFNINSLLSPKVLSTIIPVVEQFLGFLNNKSPTDSVGRDNYLDPIAFVADREIVYTLNRYFSNMEYAN